MAETTPTPGENGAADVVRIAARAYERDRYLAALLAPSAVRFDLIALAAFAGEIARIPSFVDEPMMGEIRLQWWRDELVRPPGKRSGHPIADAVRSLIARRGLSLTPFETLIDAHSARLTVASHADDAALAEDLAGTEGIQFDLAWRVLAGSRTEPAPGVVAEAGQAYGLARLALELPARLAEGRSPIPSSRLHAAGIGIAELAAGTAGPPARRLLADLASECRSGLGRVRNDLRGSELPLRTALLPVALIEPYLQALERAGDDPRGISDVAPLTRVWRLWAAYRLRRL